MGNLFPCGFVCGQTLWWYPLEQVKLSSYKYNASAFAVIAYLPSPQKVGPATVSCSREVTSGLYMKK